MPPSPTPEPRSGLSRARLLPTLLVPVALLSSCRHVEFYEKAAFSDPTMAFEQSRCEVHWYQKVFYSEEGSVGGIGTVAGGGCGCY